MACELGRIRIVSHRAGSNCASRRGTAITWHFQLPANLAADQDFRNWGNSYIVKRPIGDMNSSDFSQNRENRAPVRCQNQNRGDSAERRWWAIVKALVEKNASQWRTSGRHVRIENGNLQNDRGKNWRYPTIGIAVHVLPHSFSRG